MKYGYDGGELSNLIDNYKIINNTIVITYLDGSTHEIKCVSCDEKDYIERKILDDMLNQAKNRNDSVSLQTMENYKNLLTFVYKIKKIGYSGMWSASLTATLRNFICEKYDIKYYVIIGAVFALCISTIGVSNYMIEKYGYDKSKLDSIISEIEKYSIYLSIREELPEFSSNINFYKDLGINDGININTLDNYSLDQIKELERKLKNQEKWKKITLICQKSKI